MKRKLMKKTAVCLLSSFLILTAAMAAGQESCPSIIHVSGMQAVYAADNEAENPASKKKRYGGRQFRCGRNGEEYFRCRGQCSRTDNSKTGTSSKTASGEDENARST